MNDVDNMTIEERVTLAGAVFASDLSDLDDDDTPAMPTLEDALARIGMENAEAERAARNHLNGTDNLRTVWVRFRVSERESATIQDAKKAGGYRSTSEYLRSRVLG